MCKVSDLNVLVVENNEKELEKTCSSLMKLGVAMVYCVQSYQDAMTILSNNDDIDIVIADLSLDNFHPTGVFLCEMAKKHKPEILFLINSRLSGISFVCQTLESGVDGILNKNYINELERRLPIWLDTAVKKNNFNELLDK